MGIPEKLAVEAIQLLAETQVIKVLGSASERLAQEVSGSYLPRLIAGVEQHVPPALEAAASESVQRSGGLVSEAYTDSAHRQQAIDLLITQHLDPQSDPFQRLVSMKNVDLAELARLLKDHGDAERKALTEMIEHGATEQHLTAENVRVLAHLNGLLDLSPEATGHMMKFSPQTLTMSKKLPEYLAEQPDRMAAAKNLIESGQDPERLTPTYFAARGTLSAYFNQENSAKMARVTELERLGLNIEQLCTDVWPYGHQVESLLLSDAGVEQFATEQLYWRARLEKVFPGHEQTVERVVALSREGLSLSPVIDAVEKKLLDPEQIGALIDSGRTLKALNAEIGRQFGLKSLRQHLGENDPLIKRLLELEQPEAPIQAAGELLDRVALNNEPGVARPQQMERARVLVEEIANTRPEALRFNYLQARLNLNQSFENDGKSLKMLMDMEKDGLNLVAVSRVVGSVEGKELLVRLLNRGATASDLSRVRLESIGLLEQLYGKDSETVEQLLRLENKISLKEIATFASIEDKELVKQLAASTRDPVDFNITSLRDRKSVNRLNDYFEAESDVISYLTKLQRQSLPATRLDNFIAEDPLSRKLLVERLVAEQASVERFKNHMKLSVLPDDVAYRLVKQGESGEIRVPKLLERLKDWQSGRYYLELVTQHVRADKPLTELSLSQLDGLSKQRAELARLALPSSAPKSVWSASGLERSEAAGERQKHSSSMFPGYVQAMSRTLLDTAKRLDETIPADQTIVLLGRDAEPLLPILRQRRDNVQYFMWSRLQEKDAGTAAQWLKEVPPNAVVVDTGHVGTILNTIRKIDTYASGYLIHSAGKYPALLGDSYKRVNDLERLPKLIGRSSSYTASGGAIARQTLRDVKEAATSEAVPLFRGLRQLRWEVERQNRELLRASGLPAWDVWRYSTDFVGLTAKERLALTSTQQVEQHYEKVAQARDRLRR